MTDDENGGRNGPFDAHGRVLRGLLLDGPPETSEGLYRLDHWAVRLGRDPQSPEARMASLHEMYHGFITDSTAFGSLLHVTSMLAREIPDEPRYLQLFDELLKQSVVVQETYATYASLFIVGRGQPDPRLLVDYPADYTALLDHARDIARPMPNPVLKFQLVQAVVRAAMQPDCLPAFVASPPHEWQVSDLDPLELPDARFRVLCDPEFLGQVVQRLETWSATQTAADIREILDARTEDPATYDRLIEERLDHATDTIGGFIYDTCRDFLRVSGRSCLDFNGHQAHTGALLATAESFLPGRRRSRIMTAAPQGSVLEDLLSGFADERLVVDPRLPNGSWIWLDDIPEDRWVDLLVGPAPHALLVVRPWARVREQYAFEDNAAPPSDAHGTVVALRRRVTEPGRPAVIDHALVRSPEQLEALRSRLATSGSIIASCSMSAMVDSAWRDTWWSTLPQIGFTTILVDIDPFAQLRSWEQQGDFETLFAALTMKDQDRDHVVFTLHPDTGEGLTFLAPCSAIVSSALKVELQKLSARSGRFREDTAVVMRDFDSLNLTISHLLREEPWFDFLVNRGYRVGQ